MRFRAFAVRFRFSVGDFLKAHAGQLDAERVWVHIVVACCGVGGEFLWSGLCDVRIAGRKF